MSSLSLPLLLTVIAGIAPGPPLWCRDVVVESSHPPCWPRSVYIICSITAWCAAGCR
jgi:hypothetical protein